MINQNVNPVREPELKDVLEIFRKQIFLELNCHHIGQIQEFNPDNQTAKITINYQKTFFIQNTNTGVFEPVLKEYPILVDCPVVIMSGGTANLTFPIAKGDNCILLFNDRDIDNWFQAGNTTLANATARLHSFSDAIALVGLKALNQSIESYDTERARLQNGQAYVGVGTEKIKVANDSTTLNTLLQDLLTELQDLTSQLSTLTVTGVTAGGGVSSVPANAAAISAIGVNLSTIASQIGELLE